jgi:hypothetical protein
VTDSLGNVRNTWTSSRAIGLHATLVVLVASFSLLARWQISRALAGNGLSWAYAFEWPLFAIYACVLWWRLLHDDQPARHRRQPSAKAVANDARADDERAEYNAYLAALHDEEQQNVRKQA